MVGVCSSAGFPGWWTGPWLGLSLIPSPLAGGMEYYDRVGGGWDQSEGATTPPEAGVMSCTIRTRRGPGGCSSRRGPAGQAADVMITQAVEDQHDQFPGGGDHSDVASTPRADLIADLPKAGVSG